MNGTGVKHDQHKPRLDLVPLDALIEVAKVLRFGADKYGAHNWESGLHYSRLVGAALRHLTAFQGGEDQDQETGLPHLAHLACSALMLLATRIRDEGGILDDRPPGFSPDHILWDELAHVDSGFWMGTGLTTAERADGGEP